MVDKIKYIFIVLVLPTKSEFICIKNIHRLACGPYALVQRAHALRRHWVYSIQHYMIKSVYPAEVDYRQVYVN
jgi:hypothetical protein